MPKEEIFGSWTDFGPDKYLDDKEMHNVFKSLGQIQHPYIHPIRLCLCTDTGGLVARAAHRGGTLRDTLCGGNPRQSFLKKYGNPKGHKALPSERVAKYGRHILEALKFLHDKGLPYGHLHTGNVIIDDDDRAKLLDLENGVLGVPSFYRPYFMQHKKIHTMEAVDVYCFGHVLYEMAYGAPLRESITDDIEDGPAKKILVKILSTDACRNGLPSIADLLYDPFFSLVQLAFVSSDRAHFKMAASTKEQLRLAVSRTEERLKEEQRLVRSQKRLARVQEMMSCEEEKKKHRHKLERSKEHQHRHNKKLEKANSMNCERSDSVNSSATTSVGTSTPPSTTGSNVPSPPPPPPPPPLTGSMPPPPLANGTGQSEPKDRTQLLGAICSFDKTALRKTKVS
ncbi:unnamed protein product [Phaedon cochleariae]|uniref:PX domain-containing protein kinase-like protein n=1 Tax=Phaedon cochleariae TaxID=80249 RepID=A0A9P0DJE3_PHACE|nr:unnamed protein product [Phaedon cochleariae]